MAISIAIAGLAFQNVPKGMIPSLTSWQVIAAAVLFIWLSFTLHSMRIRDIGWDPVCVIPGWIAATVIDGLVAGKIPAIALGPGQHGTIVGALVNLALLSPCCFGQAASLTIRRRHLAGRSGCPICRRAVPPRPRHVSRGLPMANSVAARFRHVA
jgi:uncharacterized membrane protein YhaH (DUF805 family)